MWPSEAVSLFLSLKSKPFPFMCLYWSVCVCVDTYMQPWITSHLCLYSWSLCIWCAALTNTTASSLCLSLSQTLRLSVCLSVWYMLPVGVNVVWFEIFHVLVSLEGRFRTRLHSPQLENRVIIPSSFQESTDRLSLSLGWIISSLSSF